MSAQSSNRVLAVVTDGLGYDMRIASTVLTTLRESLDSATLTQINEAVTHHFYPDDDMEESLGLTLMPRVPEGISHETEWLVAERKISSANRTRESLIRSGIWEEIASKRRLAARNSRYVPWIDDDDEWNRIVNTSLTVPTQASGIWVGYEDVDPPVQGNSETGHQQIGNLALAPQIPLEITRSIERGEFFRNALLRSTLENALSKCRNVNFCFLLSGIRGSDGRVHSAWNHLEAFCEMLFSELGAPPERVRMQAILDGRDAPAHGSLNLEGIDGGYLDHLEYLLEKHCAIESLAWVVGRSIAMDRDYREENARADYLQITAGQGRIVQGFDELRETIASAHAKGLTDADIPPIIMASASDGARVIKNGDAFVNLNFRSDRQRSKTASLCAARDYLSAEASARGRDWSFDWLRDDLNLDICTIAEYDASFEANYGVKVAFQISPHRLSFLNHWDRLLPEGSRYLLVAESVKSSHMGYFVRGRREEPAAKNAEDRWIIPSIGQSEGVFSDSDFYLQPQMRTQEVADAVIRAMDEGQHRLIMCNFAAPDMIGHLLPTRFEEAVEAYGSTVSTLAELARAASRSGYSMVVTSDHGNIENDAPTHTTNTVLTTIISSTGEVSPADPAGSYSAKLFDISPTVAELLGVDEKEVARVVAEHRGDLEERYIGRSII